MVYACLLSWDRMYSKLGIFVCMATHRLLASIRYQKRCVIFYLWVSGSVREKSEAISRDPIGSVLSSDTFLTGFASIRTYPRRLDNLLSPGVPQPIKECSFLQRQRPNLERIYYMVLSFGICTNRSTVHSVVRRDCVPQYAFVRNSHIEGRTICTLVEWFVYEHYQ